LLIVAPVEYNFATKVITREECLRLNELATDIAEYRCRR
jgi:hypothetical protein